MTSKKQKLLQTAGRDREQAPATGKDGGSLSVHELRDGKLALDDRSYVLKFGRPEDFKRVREVIEDRRKQEPAFSYWKCSNPKCGWRAMFSGDKEEGPCLRCNLCNFVDGGRLIKMSGTEVEKFLADEKAAEEKWIADAPKRAAELSEFNKRIIQDLPGRGRF